MAPQTFSERLNEVWAKHVALSGGILVVGDIITVSGFSALFAATDFTFGASFATAFAIQKLLTIPRLALAVPVSVAIGRWFPGLKSITLDLNRLKEENEKQGKPGPRSVPRHFAQYGMAYIIAARFVSSLTTVAIYLALESQVDVEAWLKTLLPKNVDGLPLLEGSMGVSKVLGTLAAAVSVSCLFFPLIVVSPVWLAPPLLRVASLFKR